MNTKARTFSIISAIMAVMNIVFGICMLVAVKNFSYTTAGWFGKIILIALAVTLFIGKSRVAVLSTLATYAMLELYWFFDDLLYIAKYGSYIDEPLPWVFESAMYLLAWLAITALAVLSLCGVKAVKGMFFIPATIYSIGFIISTVDSYRYIEVLSIYGWLNLLSGLVLIAMMMFAGLYLANYIKEKNKAVPEYSTPQYSAQQFAQPQPVKPLYCSNCGTQNSSNDSFCKQCGSRLR